MTNPNRRTVSDADVRRVIARDFPKRLRQSVYDRLLNWAVGPANDGHARVRLAILKLSDGDFSEVDRLVEVALQDFRDVIAPAEERRCLRSDWLQLADDVKRQLIVADNDEYEKWLNSSVPSSGG